MNSKVVQTVKLRARVSCSDGAGFESIDSAQIPAVSLLVV